MSSLRLKKFGRRVLSVTLTATTVLWSIGTSLFMSAPAYAAVTATGPFELIPGGGIHAPANSFDMPLVRIALTQSAAETLSSIDVTILNASGGAVTNNTLANHISQLAVFQDTNNNNVFDPGVDSLAGQSSGPVSVATGTTHITISMNNTIAATSSLPTSFFITAKTAAGWTGADAFKISLATNAITTSANSPVLGATFTTANAVDAQVGGGGGGGFAIQKIAFVNQTTVDVQFTDILDLNSGQATSTANYSLSGTGASAVTGVSVLPDNKSVRVIASGANLVDSGASFIAVNNNVKNQMGVQNGMNGPSPIFGSFQPLVISEVKAGGVGDEYNEFLELYNRGGNAVATSSLFLHLINASGTLDVSVPLVFSTSTIPLGGIPSHKFFLIAPTSTLPGGLVPDATYSTSTVSIVLGGAAYVSNSSASSTAVIDRVCWGAHSVPSDCEGAAAPALANDGGSIERKANNMSTAASMAVGGTDETNGNSQDSQSNLFDFVSRTSAQPQNTGSAAENPGGGSMGGAGNQAPNIFAAPIFQATTSSAFTVVARMTDDGGPLTPANTQFIYCVTDTVCAPASSTPIYGTNVGSGWFKFSTTTGDWGQNTKAKLMYYLQAKDSANPAKTRVFTNDPSFDTVEANVNSVGGQGGIQTTALQQSKALTITISPSTLGSASITGKIIDVSGNGIGNATVWIEGTQYAAVTGNDGTFSFANVGPSGGKQLRVAKDGYADQQSPLFIPPSGVVNLPNITLYSGNMGQGGDFNQPRVTSSNPPPNSTGFPTQGPGGVGAPTIILNFSKTMDTTTFVTTTANSASANIYLTEAGNNTKLAGTVTAPTASQAQFTPTVALTAGKGYTLFVTPGVKDTAGNPVMGNGPGGQYVLMFSSTGQFFSDPGQIGQGGNTFGQGNVFPPFVIGVQPAPGKMSVARNTKIFVIFSDALQNTAGNLANVKLYQVSNPYMTNESKSEVSGYSNSLDSSGKIVIISPSSALTASNNFRVEVTGGIASSKGVTMGNPSQAGYATIVMYKTDFTTGAGNDTTQPSVSATIPAASATGVSTVNPIVVSFSEAMNPSTITDNSVTVKLGSTAVTGKLKYDPTAWTATFVPDYGFSPTSTYTINVTTDAQDLAGNALSTALLQTFTTGSSDTTAPRVIGAQANDFAMRVNFSKPMMAVAASDMNYAYSVLNPARYLVRMVDSSGALVEQHGLPNGATLTYDAAARGVAISGFSPSFFTNPVTPGSTLLNIVVSSTVKDIGYNDLTGSNAATTTTQSSAKSGNMDFGFGGMGGGPMMDKDGKIIQGGMMSGPPPMVGTFVDSGIGFAPGVKVFPFSAMAGVATTYGVEIPISYQIPNGGFIDITFPVGTDVSQAKRDQFSPPNNDLNGPGPGTVVFATNEGTLPSGFTTGGQSNDGVIVDPNSRVVRVILGAVATRCGTGNVSPCVSGDSHDFIHLDIAGIVNSSIAKTADTSGNSATVETKKADGTVLETLTSGSFFTAAAGTITVRGQVKAGAPGVNGVKVFLMSPMTGPQSTTTANNLFGGNDGEYQFQNLPAGTYMLGAEQYSKVGATNYTADFPQSITVNTTNCPSNICSRDIAVADASTGAAVTLNITGTFSSDAIDIFAGGPGTFRKVTSTLDGVLTNDTSNSIKLNSNGIWMVGFGPQRSREIFGNGGPVKPPSWMIPRPQQVVVSGCPGACTANPATVSFNVTAASKVIKFTVKDDSNNAIANAHVFAYSPNGGTGGDTVANADGTGSISLSYGTYKIAADVAGMPSGKERTILIKNDNATDKVFIDGSSTGVALSGMTNATLILTLSKPSYTISGKVTDGTNAVANVPVNAFRTDGPGHAETFTDSSGAYTLYVDNGTWKVRAFSPQYGQLPEKTITVSGASVSGQNFEPNTSAINYGTVTFSVGNDNNSDGVLGTGEGASNVQVIVEGTTGDLNNDGNITDSGENVPYVNTVLTDTNGSSTLKLPPGTYTMKAFSPTQGEMTSSTQSIIVNSAGTVTSAPYDVVAPPTGTVTVNIIDSNGAPTTTAKAAIEFMQIGGKIDKAQSVSNIASSTFTLPQFSAGTDSVALNAVTSTNPANFYLMQVNIPGISAGDLVVSGHDSGTILATSTAANGYWKVEVNGNKAIDVKLPAVKFVNGTVKDDSGNAVPDAVVHLENKNTGEAVDLQADSSGNYNTKLSNGTYLVQANKKGYIDTASTVTVNTNGALADSATTMTAASKTITGIITINGTVANGATVKAAKLGGGTVTATTNASGAYSLNVTAGDWKVSASAGGYTEKAYATVVSVSDNVSSINIDLTAAKSGLAGATSQSITPQTGGALSDSSDGTSVKADTAALADSANSFTLNEKETSNVVGGSAGAPIAGTAKDVSSLDNDGNAVTLLKKDVAVSASYSNSNLASSLGTLTVANLKKVKMASWDATADNWQNLATTVGFKDSNGKFIEPSAGASTVAYTGMTIHFSVFNPLVPSDGLAPAAPGGVAATAGSGTVTITWTAPTTNADGSALSDLLGYEIYRSTSVNGTYTQINNANIVGTTYTDNSVGNGTTYYYKVTAADTGGLESAMSGAANATPTGSGSNSGSSSYSAGPSTVATGPVLGTPAITIVGMVSSTVLSRSLTLQFVTSNATQVMMSEDANFLNANWDTYGASKAFVLSAGNGTKKLYVKFRSAYGVESPVQTVSITLNGPENEVVSTPSTTPATPVVSPTVAPGTVSGATPVPGNLTSAIQLTTPEKANYQPGEKLKFSYSYNNAGKKSLTIKIIRQLVNSKGKVVVSTAATKTLKAKATFSRKVDEAVGTKLPPGDYTVKVKIFDAKNKVLDENSFPITVEKLKKKVFKLGVVAAADSAITFEAKNLAKAPQSGKLPVKLKLAYTYTNRDEVPHKVKMMREVLDGNGKVVMSKTGKWTMKLGEHGSQTFIQSVTPAWKAGDYTIRLRAYDTASGEVLAENSLGFSVVLE